MSNLSNNTGFWLCSLTLSVQILGSSVPLGDQLHLAGDTLDIQLPSWLQTPP